MGADLHTDHSFSYNQTRIPPAIYQRQISSSHSEPSGIQDRARGTGGCRTPEVTREGSHRRSSSALRTGLSQPIICGSEATRGMASGVKCQSSKRICNQGQLQDGNVQHSSSSLGRRQMGSNIGSQGCLFPHPYASQGSTFPEVYVTEQSLAVQGAPVRADCSSVPIYLGYETSCKGTEETRDKSTYIPGRHDNFPYRRDHSQASSRYCSNSTTGIGFPHQLGEVSVGSGINHSLPGDGVYSQVQLGATPDGQMLRNQRAGSEVYGQCLHDSQTVEYSTGQAGFSSNNGSTREATSKGTSIPFASTLGLQLGSTDHSSNSHDRVSTTDTQLVDAYSKSESRKAIKSTITLQDYLHRRKSRGLGGSHGIPHGVRSVEPRGGTNAHQCFRTQSSHQHHNRVQGDVNRSNSYDSHRQHYGAGLPSESRRYEELHAFPTDTTTVCSSLRTKIGDSESAYSGQEKLPCRPFVKARSVDSYRMDSPVVSSTSVVGGLVLPGDRCICHHAQLSTSSVLLSHSRPSGSCCECTESGLERSFTVHVSSSTSHVSGVKETEEITMQRYPRVSAKSRSSVVSPSPGTISSEGKGIQKSSKKARYNIPATQRSSSSSARPTELDRNVVSSQALKERGYSDKATNLILGDIGASTKVIYDSKWKRFAVWCSEQQPQIIPHLVTEVQLAEFFSELDTDESLSSHSAIAGYRSAINSVLKCYNRQEVVFSSSISRMLQTIKRNKPRIKKNRVPKWNLALVLRHLAKKPYEPMQTINRKHLTYKTAFLVLLGTACRRSELHALDADSYEHHPQWEWINLRVLPDFMAKHQVHCADANTPRSFRLNAMVSVDKEEKMLCPVRALRYYILRSDPIRKKRRRLFLPIDYTVSGDISANTISWWIRKLIQETYDQASEEDIRLTGMQGTKPNLFRATHEIRALAGSIAWQHGTTSLKDIMSACYWQNHNVFTDHYLRDVSAVKEDQLIIASHILQAFGKM